jgi:lysine 6-dehydrogenase
VTVIPDCGVAPGMVNILAEHGIRQLDTVESVRIYVGGLPQKPEPPLNYQARLLARRGARLLHDALVGAANGRRSQVTALSEREPVEFPAPVGTLEAFHTAGGLSTMAFRYEGKIPEMEYKTLRYPGHAEIMETIRDLGLLDLDPVDLDGIKVSPRDVFVAAVGRSSPRRGRICSRFESPCAARRGASPPSDGSISSTGTTRRTASAR